MTASLINIQANATSGVFGNVIPAGGDTDSEGNTYVVGYLFYAVDSTSSLPSADFGGTTLTQSRSNKTIYFAKYNAADSLCWVKGIGSEKSIYNADGSRDYQNCTCRHEHFKL